MRKKLLYFLILIPLFNSCVKLYNPPAIITNYGYLVIEGDINASPNGITSIAISRTTNLSDSIAPVPEMNDNVMIEGQNGELYQLSAGDGKYFSTPLNLNINIKYRLKISTTNGSKYVSDFVEVLHTPPIDSITWKQNQDVTIYAHTHDPQNLTKYYRWDYDETFQQQSSLTGELGLNNGKIFYLDASTQLHDCWPTVHSSNISIASTAALLQDVVSYVPIQLIPKNNQRLAIRYSINVRQYALTKSGYEYWEIIQKGTQQSGTIFDPQPAQLIGNFHCLTNPSEPVIGFASVSNVSEKRIFINKNELNDWVYDNVPSTYCDIKLASVDPQNYLNFSYPDTSYMPYYFQTSPGGVFIARKVCLDCRRQGGTNIKPSFW